MSMRVTFLGTSGAVPTTERAPSALLVNREGERFLFDCGEGTQRQMMRFGTGFNVTHLFVTHLHGDHILGIPGLIQSWDFNGRDDPLAIHVPPGSKKHIKSLVHAGGYDPSYAVNIHEVAPGKTALAGDGYEVRTFKTNHRTKSQGYAIVEEDRPGRFDREKAEEELGIPPGPMYGKLHNGETVELDDGTVIRPEQVVGEPRPGRTLVYTGDTRPVQATVDIAHDADLLIHDATFTTEEAGRARQTYHSTAQEAADVASRANAKRLALTHISSRYAGNAGPIEREGREGFDGECFVPDDGQKFEVPFPDDE
ncbi:RNAse Z [Halogranum gelatinilyticum]|uniref:Ribonuclease Z n=2 Tax=Halogranum gelatinilyticum TaxID=660521 RepID=A0A1G9PA01_9EURY|nr:RNAse Z [Halogranum gelatinilyticum]